MWDVGLLEDRTSYGETFFVPRRARWHESWIDEKGQEVPPLKDLKHDIGNMLNKAIAAIEDELGLTGEIDWEELPERKASRIRAFSTLEFDNTDSWEPAFRWLAETCIEFKKTFSKRWQAAPEDEARLTTAAHP